MITILSLILLGAVLGVGCLIAACRLDADSQRRAQARRMAERERRRSEARIQQITQDAVAQMMAVARQEGRRDV